MNLTQALMDFIVEKTKKDMLKAKELAKQLS